MKKRRLSCSVHQRVTRDSNPFSQENRERLRAAFERSLKDFREFREELEMLKRVRMSAVDAAYARELQAEIEAIRKKLLTHPSATEDELNELRR